MKTRVLHTHCLIGTFTLLTPFAARSALNMTLSGTPGSSIIDVSFTGSCVANFSGSFINFGWQFIPTTFNPFPAAITGDDYGLYDFINGTPSLTINGVARQFPGVWLQDSSNSPYPGYERFGGRTPSFNSNPGDVWAWSGTAQIDLSPHGLTFDDLNLGSITLWGERTVLEGSLTIVPEPTITALTIVGLLAILLRRVKSLRGR